MNTKIKLFIMLIACSVVGIANAYTNGSYFYVNNFTNQGLIIAQGISPPPSMDTCVEGDTSLAPSASDMGAGTSGGVTNSSVGPGATNVQVANFQNEASGACYVTYQNIVVVMSADVPGLPLCTVTEYVDNTYSLEPIIQTASVYVAGEGCGANIDWSTEQATVNIVVNKANKASDIINNSPQ